MKISLNSSLFWDLWCTFSIVGIWPRFIEPNLLLTTHLTLPVAHLPKSLEGLHIVQMSDLHFNNHTSTSFLNRLTKKIKKLQPDILLITGDFLSYSSLMDPTKLQAFLNHFKEPLFKIPFGCYAILGNHDYEKTISMNKQGYYDLASKKGSLIQESLSRLLFSSPEKKGVSCAARKVPPHPKLVEILADSPFELLDNCTKTLPIRNSYLNITGLGEHMLGRCLPEEAFKNYQEGFPGIVMVHNPDSVKSQLLNFPGDLLLAGHTHGAQLNLPFLWNRFTQLENPEFKRGLFQLGKKWLYVNRGIGSVLPFRWFSPPEILSIKLAL